MYQALSGKTTSLCTGWVRWRAQCGSYDGSRDLLWYPYRESSTLKSGTLNTYSFPSFLSSAYSASPSTISNISSWHAKHQPQIHPRARRTSFYCDRLFCLRLVAFLSRVPLLRSRVQLLSSNRATLVKGATGKHVYEMTTTARAMHNVNILREHAACHHHWYMNPLACLCHFCSRAAIFRIMHSYIALNIIHHWSSQHYR